MRNQILFVHGPDVPETIWSTLNDLLKSFKHINEKYSLCVYQHDDSSTSLSNITYKFENWYKVQKKQLINSSIILIGHGLGGIIIQNFIVKKLINGQSNEFYNLRQILLFSTPHLGYNELSFNSRLLGMLTYKKTIKFIKIWNAEIIELNELIREYIIDTTEFNSYYRPVSIKSFSGKSDTIVNSISAKGYHSNFKELPGDYHSTLNPIDSKDILHREFISCLLVPPAHKGIYLIEELNVYIKVEPFLEGCIKIKYGEKDKTIYSDNYGLISRKLKFSSNNICFNPYTLRYGIENKEGCIDAVTAGGENITSQENIDLYETKKLEYFFEFVPVNGNEFSLDVSLYKGFDQNFRDTHFHLGNGKAWYNKIKITLDLEGYRLREYDVNPLPILMLHPEDSHSCNMRFAEREISHIIPHFSNNEYIWKWEIYDIGGGVLDLFWDVKDKINE